MISDESVNVIETSLLGPTNPASAYVPKSDSLGNAWQLASFTEGSGGDLWQTGTNGVGYENGYGYESLINIDSYFSSGTNRT